MSDVLLSVEGLSKEFPGVRALDGVDFELLAGEVHAIFGENGAGKSTLISIIAGAQAQDSGTIRMHGAELRFSSVADARRQGISAVFQEFSLAPHLTVEENLCMGEEQLHQRFGLLQLSAMSGSVDFVVEHLVAREGEVVGVAGLVGCGKSELLRMAFGIEPMKSGIVKLDGQILSLIHISEPTRRTP